MLVLLVGHSCATSSILLPAACCTSQLCCLPGGCSTPVAHSSAGRAGRCPWPSVGLSSDLPSVRLRHRCAALLVWATAGYSAGLSSHGC